MCFLKVDVQFLLDNGPEVVEKDRKSKICFS